MQVTISYYDDQSFTMEEVVRNAQATHGKAAKELVMPDSSKPHDLIYFGLSCMITHQQLSLLYDDKLGYQSGIKKLRAEALYKIQEIIDQVIIDNEAKVEG